MQCSHSAYPECQLYAKHKTIFLENEIILSSILIFTKKIEFRCIAQVCESTFKNYKDHSRENNHVIKQSQCLLYVRMYM